MSRPLRWALLLIAMPFVASPEPGDAAVRYIAFGDSNTRGNDCTDPGQAAPPGFVFDDDGTGCNPGGTTCATQTQDDADNCGYAYRLESELAAGVPGADVINAGSAGETTVDGLARIDGKIAAGDDVLILIEGTNDISAFIKGDPGSIPPAQIADNLGIMIDKATALGMDTIVGAPIRRICPEFPGECAGHSSEPPLPDDPRPEANPDEPVTMDMDGEVATLTDEKFRKPRAGSWFKMGKDQGDVDAQYFQGELRFGHLRGSGFGKLAKDLLKVEILSHVALGAPSPISPSGDTDDSGVFSWNDYANQTEGATLWQLQIDGPLGGTFHDEFYEHDLICASGTCTVDVGTLGVGAYTWKVRGKNLRGPSPYSADTAFTVVGDLPGSSSLLYPLEELFENDPSFEWTLATDATQYTLEIDGSSEIVSDSACGSKCAIIRGQALSLGSHSWRVRPENSSGSGPWTALGSFDVVECSVGQLVLDAGDTGTGSLFEACGIIFAGAGFTVQTGEQVIFHAGNVVQLENGFVIEAGAEFEAHADH